MAERVSIFSVLFALCFSVALSRTLPPQTPRTATLDVSASIQKTVEVFSPESAQLDQTFSPPSSSLSFRLHSLSTVHRAQHRDYKSLTLARLGRDAARAKSLQARLDLAISGFAVTDLEPDGDMVFEEEALPAPVISGTFAGLLKVH